MAYLYSRSFFAYFDEKKCRWDKETHSCDDYAADFDVTLSDSETDADDSETDADDKGDSENDTSVADETSSDVTTTTNTVETQTIVANTDLTIEPTTKPAYQNLECDSLDETWICSSGSRNHSLCIKFCTVGLDFHVFISCDSPIFFNR